jgi:hypothetical protein
LAALKSASNDRDALQSDAGNYSDDDEQLNLDLVQREEKLEAALTRVHNCMLSSQKLNTQIMLMLKGWKATL